MYNTGKHYSMLAREVSKRSTEIGRALRILAHGDSEVMIADSTSTEEDTDHGSSDKLTIVYPGGVVEGDFWHLAEWLCQRGSVSSTEALLRCPEMQRRWIASSHPVDPVQIEALFNSNEESTTFLCGDKPCLADLYVSIHLCSQQWGKDNDHLYPLTLHWITQVQKVFPSWLSVQYEIYLDQVTGASDEEPHLLSIGCQHSSTRTVVST